MIKEGGDRLGFFGSNRTHPSTIIDTATLRKQRPEAGGFDDRGRIPSGASPSNTVTDLTLLPESRY